MTPTNQKTARTMGQRLSSAGPTDSRKRERTDQLRASGTPTNQERLEVERRNYRNNRRHFVPTLVAIYLWSRLARPGL